MATGVKPTAQKPAGSKQTATKVVKTTEADSIQANTAVITRNKVGSVVTPATERIEHVPNVRVLLGSRSSDAKGTSTANMVVLNSNNGQVSTISANRGTSVGVRDGKIVVNGKAIDSVVTLKPANSDAPFLFEGKGYRGGLTLRANNGKMMVINSVPLEDYLYGVVPQEVRPQIIKSIMGLVVKPRLLLMQSIRQRVWLCYIINALLMPYSILMVVAILRIALMFGAVMCHT